MRLSFLSRAGQTQHIAHASGGTAIISRADVMPLPFMKTPWVYSGPNGLDVSRVLATPLVDDSAYVLTHVAMNHHGPMLGRTIKTDVLEHFDFLGALNRMQNFVNSHEDAPFIFTFEPSYTDFRKCAKRSGLRHDWHLGFVDKSTPETPRPVAEATPAPAA